MNRTLATAAGAITGILALGACGALGYGGTAEPDTTNAAAQTAVSANQAAGTEDQAAQPQAKVLRVQQVAGFTPLVTSASGRTVYRFDNDSAKPSETTCLDECAKTWEPVLAGSGVVVEGGGIDEAKLGTVDRPEGQQVTLKGWPLYYYKDDVKLGQTAGHGIGDVWFAVNPKGGKAKRTAASTDERKSYSARSSSSQDSTAQDSSSQDSSAAKPAAKVDVQVLTVKTVDGFMPFVTNGKGRTIYRFDNDSANPSQSTCFGDCAKTWEPVLVGKNGFEIKGNKIDAADVATVDRPEGKQLTLKGWPLYYFHTDKVLGQTAGHGKGNVWFAIAPNGKKAQRCP